MSLPERRLLLRTVNRQQNRTRPQNPRTLQDVSIVPPYNLTTNGATFLQFDSGEDDDSRMLIFYSDRALEVLCGSEVVQSDGTFKTPPRLFYQLYTFHANFFGHTFPLIYVLAANKTTATYKRILEHLQQAASNAGLTFAPTHFIVDFEIAFMNAIRVVLPATQVHGCLFHLTQAFWRYAVTNCGLRAAFSEDENVKNAIQMLFALPFLPLEDLEETFDLLYNDIPDSVISLWEYIEATYVRGRPARGRRRAISPRFAPSTWNVYSLVRNRMHRTTNIAESWHSKFQKMIQVHHSSVWKFIEFLKIDQRDTEVLMTQLAGGHSNIKHPVKRKHKQNQEHLERIVDNYDEYKSNGNYALYLRAVSYTLKRNYEAVEVVEEEVEEE